MSLDTIILEKSIYPGYLSCNNNPKSNHRSVATMEDPGEKEAAIREVFETIDVDDNGNLSLKEVVIFLKGVMDDISEENMRNIFQNLDKNEDHMIDFEEFKVRDHSSYSAHLVVSKW